MKLEMLAVYDAKVGQFMTPFFAQSVGAATRSFTDLARDPSHEVGKHPEDYSLFWLGTWYSDGAGMEMQEAPQQVVLAINLTER